MNTHAFLLNEKTGRYWLNRAVTQTEIIGQAKALLASDLERGDALTSPSAVKDYLTLMLGDAEQELFACVFLDTPHRVIAFETLFYGTIDGASVYPREVVKRALTYNAAAVIFAHNHPSGLASPSEADKSITRQLKDALALVDVRVLDHFVVGSSELYSFAEHGLI